MTQALLGVGSRHEVTRALLVLACETTGHARGLLALFDSRGRIEHQVTHEWTSEISSERLQQARYQVAPSLDHEDQGMAAQRVVVPIGPAGRGVLMLESPATDTPERDDLLALAEVLSRLLGAWLDEAGERHQLREELRRARYGQSASATALLASARLVPVRLELQQLARGVGPVFLQAEDGSETEDLARFLHTCSPHTATGSFLAFHAAAHPAHRLEEDLLGNALLGGAGARASCATVLVDQPEALSSRAQLRLAELVSGEESRVRLVAASPRTLADLVKSGMLQAPLAELLSAARLVVPPLRAQPSDIPSLVELILREMGPTPEGTPRTIGEKAMQHLLAFSWPGNVRQLRQALESAAGKAGNQPIAPKHLAPEVRAAHGSRDARFPRLRDVEKRYITEVLYAVRSKREAAKVLGIAPSTLYEKLARYAIEV